MPLISQRDVDAGESRNRQTALPLITKRIVEDRPELFGLARVLADQPGGIGRDHRRIGPRRPKAFAPADRPVVAFDLDQHMRAPIEAHRGAFERHGQPVLQEMGADGGDFHGTPPSPGQDLRLWLPISASSISTSAPVRSVSGLRTGPALNPCSRTPAFTAATA